MSVPAFHKSYKQLIHVFHESPEPAQPMDHLFSQTMVGLDETFATSLLQNSFPKSEKKKVTAPKPNTKAAMNAIIAKHRQSQKSDYNATKYKRYKLYQQMHMLPCAYVLRHLTHTLEKVATSSFLKSFTFPSSYTYTGGLVVVQVPQPALDANTEKIVDLVRRAMGGWGTLVIHPLVTKHTFVIRSHWVPLTPTPLVLLDAVMVNKECHVSGACVENQDYVLYKKKDDEEPVEPIIVGPCCEKWSPDNPFKNRALTSLLAYVHTFNSLVEGSCRVGRDGQPLFVLTNFLEKDVGKLRYVCTMRPDPMYQKHWGLRDKLDRYVWYRDDKVIDALLDMHFCNQATKTLSRQQYDALMRNLSSFKTRSIVCAVFLLLVGLVFLAFLGMISYALVKRHRLGRGSSTVVSKTENVKSAPTTNANPNTATQNPVTKLSGGQLHPNLFQNPIETLSVMIDTLNHRVENL